MKKKDPDQTKPQNKPQNCSLKMQHGSSMSNVDWIDVICFCSQVSCHSSVQRCVPLNFSLCMSLQRLSFLFAF